MPLQEDYQVTLEAFCGPLDLLLFLVRRAEVDIHEIPIARIADQYLAFLRQLDDIDIELAGEFLVMAATLMELKSRTLMPQTPDDADGAGAAVLSDPRQELVQQLLDYQRHRIAADALETRRAAFSQRHPCRPARADRTAGMTEPEPDLDLEDVHALDLSEAYERIMASIDFTRLGDHRVEVDDTPLALYQEDLIDRLRRCDDGRLTLQDVFAGHTRGQRIGLFLASLELVRTGRITVRQEAMDRPIEIVLEEATERRGDEASEWQGRD